MEKIKKSCRTIYIFCLMLYYKIYHKVRGEHLTEKGERLRIYLYKVLTEDYKPQTMADFDDERTFNPEELEGEERLKRARDIWFILMEY